MKLNNIYKTLLAAAVVAPTLLTASCSDDNNPTPPPPGPAEAIEVDFSTSWEAFYFEPNYNHDPEKPTYSNYFCTFVQGAVAASGLVYYPMVEGEYLLDLDLNTLGLSETPRTPAVPTGKYTASNSHATDKDVDHTFDLTNTILIKNMGAAADGAYRFHFYRFETGEINISAEGNTYTVTADLTCTLASSDPDADGKPATEPTRFKLTFKGEIPVENPKEEETPYFYDKPINMTGVFATAATFNDGDTDNIIFRCFSSLNLTSDAMHVAAEGMKLQLSLYAPKNQGIAGSYDVKDGKIAGAADPGSRWGSMANGSYVEVVNEDLTVQYSLLKSGRINIRETSDGNYSVVVDCVDSNGNYVNASFSGKINTGTIYVPTTTLRSDLTFNPQGCSDFMSFGDFFGNGTTDVWVTLADETRALTLDLVLPGENVTTLPEGRFEVKNSTDAWTAISGLVEGGSITPTMFVEYAIDGTSQSVINYASIHSGWVEIKRVGADYKFTFELYDNYSKDMVTPAFNKISGTVTCPVPPCHLYEGATNVASRGLRTAGKPARAVRK